MTRNNLPVERRFFSLTSTALRSNTSHIVEIGRLLVAREPARLITVLGSCVGLALYDPALHLGGLAHVMLPYRPPGRASSGRYAEGAVEALQEALQSAGANKSRLVAKMAGGAAINFNGSGRIFDQIGSRNVEIIKKQLKATSIPLLGEDIGGTSGRRMILYLKDFRIRVVMLRGDREQGP